MSCDGWQTEPMCTDAGCIWDDGECFSAKEKQIARVIQVLIVIGSIGICFCMIMCCRRKMKYQTGSLIVNSSSPSLPVWDPQPPPPPKSFTRPCPQCGGSGQGLNNSPYASMWAAPAYCSSCGGSGTVTNY